MSIEYKNNRHCLDYGQIAVLLSAPFPYREKIPLEYGESLCFFFENWYISWLSSSGNL